MYDSEKIRAAAEAVIKARCTDAAPYTEYFAACESYDAEATPETVLALLDEIEALRKDAERYRWIAARFTGFDFDWMPSEENAGDGKFVLCFEMDKKMRISRDVTASIDVAMTQGGDA